jgi:hypothetical protein
MTIAIMLVVTGVVLCVLNIVLVRHYIIRFSPQLLKIDAIIPPPAKGQEYMWEKTAGMGLVAKWVSALGLLAIPIFGIGITLLLIALLSRVF